MNIFAFLFTIGLFMASVARSSTASLGFSHSLRSLEDVKEEPPPKEDESRNRAPELRGPDDLSQGVSFTLPICHTLPGGRVPTFEEIPVNEGWTLVDFCLEGTTGNGPAQPPICHHNDDDSSSEDLDFWFDFFGTLYNKVYINNNGNLSFESRYSAFSSTGFPSAQFKMVAPFWADVDTRGEIGRVWRKKLPGNAFAIAWDHVGYFSRQGDLRNTFQVVVSDGTNAEMGLGNNVCFCYEDMQWTTGGASGGSGGFGGVPATVGTNNGDGIDYTQIGRYDTPGAGPQGIDNLDNQAFCFPVTGANVPPIVSNVPAGNQIDLACDEALVDYTLNFAAPEFDQLVTLVVQGESDGLTVAVGDGIQTATATLNWVPTYAATVYLTLSPTDSEGAVTQTTVVVTSPGPCPPVCTPCDFSALIVFPDSAEDGKVEGYDTLNGAALHYACGLMVAPEDTTSFITVLDSESPVRNTNKKQFDPDLGSPHKSCGGVGRGKGGRKNQPWENCEPLGNVLILQDPRYVYPNDDIAGGCMKFTFDYPITNLTIGLLDIDSAEAATITLYDHYNAIIDTFTAPKNIGDNGYWTSDSPKNTDPALLGIAAARHVTAFSVCLSRSGAITHVDYCSDPHYPE